MRVTILLAFVLLSACTTDGKLDYITSNGENKSACQTEYSGAPAVDKYAVEYVLAYCARKAVEKGHNVIDKSLLSKDLSIPVSSNGRSWTFEYATEQYRAGKLTDKEFGYIIAYIDLGIGKKPSKGSNVRWTGHANTHRGFEHYMQRRL